MPLSLDEVVQPQANELAHSHAGVRQDPNDQRGSLRLRGVLEALDLVSVERLDQALREPRQLHLPVHRLALGLEPGEEALGGLRIGPRRLLRQFAALAAVLEQVTDEAILLTRPEVRRLAGARAFSAGTDYAAAGAVRITARSKSEVTANVQGTRRYRVKLTADEGELLYECTCPVGEDGQFCKHCAAVAVEAADWGGGRRTRRRPAVTMDDVREHLMGYRKQALVDLVLARAEEDDGLRDQLLMTDFDGPLREDRRLPGVSAASGIDDRAHDQDVLPCGSRRRAAGPASKARRGRG